jgi:hypothetical protein
MILLCHRPIAQMVAPANDKDKVCVIKQCREWNKIRINQNAKGVARVFLPKLLD